MPPADPDQLKAAAARTAVELVEEDMLLGLGSGSTAAIFLELLIERVRAGLRIAAVPTSTAIAERAAAGGIRTVRTIDRPLDLAVDGADEIDPRLDLLKGRGGALVREKLVAVAARRFVVIADESKLVDRLGVGPVPVEVLPFLWRETAHRLEALGAEPALRGGEASPFVSDNGNLVLDCTFSGALSDARALAGRIKSLTGVVDHGIFDGVATEAVVAGPDGVRRLTRP